MRKEKLIISGNIARKKGSGSGHCKTQTTNRRESIDPSKLVADGVSRKLKRGRRMKSVCSETGLERVVLDGGTHLANTEIRACNSMLMRMGETNPKLLWKIRKSLGFLFSAERESIIRLFPEWETRDIGINNNKSVEQVK